jgi:peptide/nickel transport system substrate-binding protein
VLPLKHGAEASTKVGKSYPVFAAIVGSRARRHAAIVGSRAWRRASTWSALLCLIGACRGDAADGPALTMDGAQARAAGERVVILPREPDELDPRYVGDAYGLKLSRLLHASLVTIDPATLEPVLDLAASIATEGPQRYRVELKPGLRFADGSSLDAQDVVATFRALVDPQVKSRYRSMFARLSKVSAAGSHSVVFELSEPHATFVTDLEMPVLRSEDAFRRFTAAEQPVGAGPYLLRSRTRGSLLLAPNPHHRSPSQRGELRFIVVRDDNVRALRMLAGAGDLAQGVLPHLLLPLFERRPELRVRSAKGAGTTYIAVNLLHSVLRDVRVRRAIAHAIDRPGLIRHKLGGHASLASSWIPEGHWAYAADTPSHAHDPAGAQRLLAEAGHTGSPPLTLVLRTSSDRSIVSLGRALASMLAGVGIELEVRPSETATLLSDLARGRFELALMQVPELFEPHLLSWFFASDRIPEPGVREGGNRFRMRNAELDRALALGAHELQRERRAAIYRDVQHLLARELPVIPLWHEDVIAVVSRQLFNYEVPRDARFGTLAR